jgi:hypothetical protein
VKAIDQECLEQSRILLNPEVVAKRLDEELIIIHLGTDRIYSLNSSAARFWELLDSGLGVLEAKQQLVEEFAVSMQELDDDIHNVLKLLFENQLIRVEK